MQHDVGGLMNKMLQTFLGVNMTVIIIAALNSNYRNTVVMF
jgi:hypothetical protein